MAQEPQRQMTGAPDSASTPMEDLVGHVVGDSYDVIERVYSGAAGALFLARHGGDGRELTLRLFPREVGSDEATARTFNKEARVLSELRHPNLFAVVDFGVTDAGSRFIVTECPQTRTLRDVLTREVRIPAERAVSILMQLVRALAMARGAGVMHGNLKAENVLVLVQAPGKHDVIKLQDVGVARLMRIRPSVAQNMVMATPRTMAPEQVVGVMDDPRSDVYALGCILFEMLTGRPPFESMDDARLLSLHRDAPIPTLQSAHPAVVASQMLQALVARMLAKKPEGRPTHARLLEEVEILPEYIETDDRAALGPVGMDGPSLGMPVSGADVGGPALGLSTAPSPSTDEFAARRSKDAGIPVWVFGAAAGLFVLVVGGVALSGGSKESTPPPVAAPEPQAPEAPAEPSGEVDVDVAGMKLTARKKAPAAPAKPAPAAATKPVAAAPAPTPAPSAPAIVQVSVTSSPAGAQVFDGPIMRGSTPATLLLPNSTSPRTIRISLEGYDDVIRAVLPEAGATVHVTLKKSAEEKEAKPETPAKEEEKEAPADAPQ